MFISKYIYMIKHTYSVRSNFNITFQFCIALYADFIILPRCNFMTPSMYKDTKIYSVFVFILDVGCNFAYNFAYMPLFELFFHDLFKMWGLRGLYKL